MGFVLCVELTPVDVSLHGGGESGFDVAAVSLGWFTSTPAVLTVDIQSYAHGLISLQFLRTDIWC